MIQHNLIEIEYRISGQDLKKRLYEIDGESALEFKNVIRRRDHDTLVFAVPCHINLDFEVCIDDAVIEKMANGFHQLREQVSRREILIVVRPEWDRSDIAISREILVLAVTIMASVRVYFYQNRSAIR